MEIVRYTYRLRPGAVARRVLSREAGMARWVWNQCVGTDRDRRKVGERLSGYDMKRELTTWRREHEWLAEGSSVVQQETVLDWGRARKASFTVKGHRQPRFHAKHRCLPSISYTRRGFSIRSGRLRLAGGTVIPVIWSRDLPSEPTSVRVTCDAVGDWWATFTVRREQEKFPSVTAEIGVDWGVRTTATTTDPAFDLTHAERGKHAARRLARYQRQMARRAPEHGHAGSKGYRHAKKAAAKQHRAVARQRRDTARKWARRVVEHHDRIAVENFRPKFLSQSRMARKAADATIGATKQALLEYGVRAGRTVVLVPPAYTTMTCSGCGARTKPLTLAERIFACPSCGLIADRDRNAAKVILAAAGFNGACVDGVRHESPSGDRAA